MGSDKERALDLAMGQIDKMFGKGSIMRLGEMSSRIQTEVIPTGCLQLDIALGVGGIPRGRIIEIYGNESSGKTTLTYHVIAEAQKAGGTCAFIDAEHALDPVYAAKCGVNVDELLLSQPDTGEQALDIADLLVRSGAIDAFVIDSVAALVPRAELEGEMGDSQVGLQARLMSKALRKLAGSLNKSRCAGIFINQIREKVGVMFGNPETTPGGRALKFWSSVRIELRRVENIKSGTDIVGSRTRAKVVKNKVSPPFRQADFDIMYGTGISRGGGILDLGVELGLINKTGAFFSYNDTRIGHGRDNARVFLDENPEIAQDIEQQIRQMAMTNTDTDAVVPGDEDEAEPLDE
ncbi:MAG TPA: recombinase RecA [Armatimonadota bacterium]|nr:recombinase RecA [Armatimonadota bacterium]